VSTGPKCLKIKIRFSFFSLGALGGATKQSLGGLRDTACLHFEAHLFEKQIGNQPPQPRIFKLKFGSSCLLCLIAARTVRLRRQLPPTMQGHDAHAERVRNLALRLSLLR